MPAATTARLAEIRLAALELFTQRSYEATTMADIGARVGMRGPSLYKHVGSKQILLADIMVATMDALLEGHDRAIAGVDEHVDRLRRAVEAHVRYHARNRLEAFVGNRELRSLEEPHRTAVLDRRASYERSFRTLIEDGVAAGRFRVQSAKLASYAILDLGMGVATWYREDAELTENEVVWQYVDFALRLVGAHI
ncbi:TetR/AcrR family transcriptional regulator [Lentzea albidocapillata]|uniref:Transcriptional regulator, TetR family n=1 Tax=Lentzea albidocapillata TaxID=40571 RepID=A0A1W2BGF0_9PSEU|nr:TetR/AcrR family transcriptional regulator [Lentzea albidocapillata]SMC71904.1 transcriptional regulator, TetR family [Lentzea albidocapillata]